MGSCISTCARTIFQIYKLAEHELKPICTKCNLNESTHAYSHEYDDQPKPICKSCTINLTRMFSDDNNIKK